MGVVRVSRRRGNHQSRMRLKRTPAAGGSLAPVNRLAATAVAVALSGLLASPAPSAAARAPEDFGGHAVGTTRVHIKVPVDPRGPEGVLPRVAADVYVPVGRGPWPLVQISHA